MIVWWEWEGVLDIISMDECAQDPKAGYVQRFMILKRRSLG